MDSNSGLLPEYTPTKRFSYFQHPQAVCMSYLSHCMFSLKLAKYFAVGSMKAIIHAFFPSLFITSSSDLLITMKGEMDQLGCRSQKE